MDEKLIVNIRTRYENVLARISDAALRSGRNPDAVRLVVVSKAQPLEVVQAAVAAGVHLLGENYVEEAAGKIAAFQDASLEWHMIGHVQSRKAEQVAAQFQWLHSLDSLKLAERLERFCSEAGRQLPVLLECNVSGEESKYGFPAWDEPAWGGLAAALEPITRLPHLQVRGLMTMPPFYDDPERTRPYFQKLRRLQGFLGDALPQSDWRELSMGTSVDFVPAVEEGATFVRVGQAIMGARSR